MAAFTYTKIDDIAMGNRRATYGTFTNTGGATGGSIYSGLQKVEFMVITPTTAVTASQAACTTTLPSADPVTIVATADADGMWMAIGF